MDCSLGVAMARSSDGESKIETFEIQRALSRLPKTRLRRELIRKRLIESRISRKGEPRVRWGFFEPASVGVSYSVATIRPGRMRLESGQHRFDQRGLIDQSVQELVGSLFKPVYQHGLKRANIKPIGAACSA